MPVTAPRFPDLAVPGAWEQTFLQTYTGDRMRYYGRPPRLPILDSPIRVGPLTSFFVAIGAGSESAKPTWNAAGRVFIELPAGVNEAVILGGYDGGPDAVDLPSEVVPLNSILFLENTAYSLNWHLRFEPVPWLEDLILSVWEYRGEYVSPAEQTLEQIKQNLDFISEIGQTPADGGEF